MILDWLKRLLNYGGRVKDDDIENLEIAQLVRCICEDSNRDLVSEIKTVIDEIGSHSSDERELVFNMATIIISQRDQLEQAVDYIKSQNGQITVH